MDWMLQATAVADREAERIEALNDVDPFDLFDEADTTTDEGDE